jgi:hypothetical protein
VYVLECEFAAWICGDYATEFGSLGAMSSMRRADSAWETSAIVHRFELDEIQAALSKGKHVRLTGTWGSGKQPFSEAWFNPLLLWSLYRERLLRWLRSKRT